MSHPARMSVGIAGITGKFAGLILDNLLKDPTVRVRGYCRNAAKLANRYSQSTQLEILEGDAHDQVALSKFVENLDVVVCAYLGDNDFMVSAQKALVDACDQARVARYIASDYCLDYTSLKLGDLPAKDPMKIIHSYVHGKQHVKGVHVLIGAFMETFWSNYFQIWNTNDKALVYWGTGDETWESTTYGDAAEYTAAIALDPTAVGFKKCKSARQMLDKRYNFGPSCTYGLQFLVIKRACTRLPEIWRKPTDSDLSCNAKALSTISIRECKACDLRNPLNIIHGLPCESYIPSGNEVGKEADERAQVLSILLHR